MLDKNKVESSNVRQRNRKFLRQALDKFDEICYNYHKEFIK